MDRNGTARFGAMSIMDSSGHKELQWDKANPEEALAAKAAFERLLEEGYSAFGAHQKDDTKHLIGQFDATLDEIVMVPRIVGG